MRKNLSVPRRRYYQYKRKISRNADKLKGNNPILIHNPKNIQRDKVFKIEDYDIRQHH